MKTRVHGGKKESKSDENIAKIKFMGFWSFSYFFFAIFQQHFERKFIIYIFIIIKFLLPNNNGGKCGTNFLGKIKKGKRRV